jgi:LysM repeat protein
MPDFKPNQFVRALAVAALVTALIAVVAIVITTSGSSDNGGRGTAHTKSKGPTKRGRQAINKGVWVVRSGDTLGRISQQTGIDVDTLIQLNPDLDPQAMPEGQKVVLR